MGLARIIVPLFPGIHAREWISPAVCTYVIREIVENAATNGYVDQINFHFLPVANPDGYEYTFSTVSCTSSLQLIGVTVNHPFWPYSNLKVQYIRVLQSSLYTYRTACGEKRGLRKAFATEWTRTGTSICTGEVSGVYQITT